MLEGSCVAPPAVMCMLSFRSTALLTWEKSWVLLLFKRLGTDAHQDWDRKHARFFFSYWNFKILMGLWKQSTSFPHLSLSASTVWRFAITNSTYRCHQFNSDSGTSDATGMISMHFIKINSQLFFLSPFTWKHSSVPKIKNSKSFIMHAHFLRIYFHFYWSYYIWKS